MAELAGAVKTHCEGRDAEDASLVFGQTTADGMQHVVDSAGEIEVAGGFVDIGSGHGAAVIAAVQHKECFTSGWGVEAVEPDVAAATAAVPDDLKEKVEFAHGNASELNAEKVAGAAMIYWVATHFSEEVRGAVVAQVAEHMQTGAVIAVVTHPALKGHDAFKPVGETQVATNCGDLSAFLYQKLLVEPPAEEE